VNRRAFIVLLGSAVAWPLAVIAQQPARRPFIALLSPITRETATANIEAFRRALRDLGYVEGESIAVEYRFAEGRRDILAALATEFVGRKPDVIVAGSTDAVLALQKVTDTIPVVGIAMTGDLVRLGLIVAYNRPGGHVTGTHFPTAEEMIGKRISLLKELVPGITRIGVVVNPEDIGGDEAVNRAADQFHRTLTLDIRFYPLREASQFETVFGAVEQQRVEALCVMESILVNANRERIVASIDRLRRPAVYGFREFAAAGGLMSYSANLPDQYRRAATYADKILKGAKPGDLPIDESREFDLTINLIAAKSLGLAVPPALLAQATEVIE